MQQKSYKQITVLSGKGGTGKTILTAALAGFMDNKIIIDCDVDAANLYLILQPIIANKYEFSGGKKAVIENDKCRLCGLCEAVCRFDAIKNFKVNALSCEGCGFCFRICPDKAIRFTQSKSGTYFECQLKDESKFYYAKLLPGEGNSGKLVSEIKKKALENISRKIKWIIIDGPPGIGCPVNAAVSGADYAVVVTEPTLSGIHDLKRIVELLKIFKVRAGIVINKYDLNEAITKQILSYSKNENIPVIGLIPFDNEVVNALINCKNITDFNKNIREKILTIYKEMESQIDISFN